MTKQSSEGWDVVVIGSGSGGLTAALACARRGLRVQVLEQHYLPGGFMHSFSLEGYRFSPGVHYVGGCGPGGSLRRLYEGLGITQEGEVAFCEMNPDGYDHLLIAGERFDVPAGKERFIQRLTARFPHERRGIRRYFDVCLKVNEQVCKVDSMLSFPEVLSVPFKAPTLLRWGLRTQGALLDACVKDPQLRAILAAQSGNHGLAPSRVSLPIQSGMITHYLDGAFYPRGGAKAIPAAMIKHLRRLGGKIRTSTRVKQILVERGRAIGVELEDGEKIFAGAIISNADPAVTYRKLLRGEAGARERKKVARMTYSVSMVSVFAAVDMDLRALGYDSGNYWYYRDRDVNGLYERFEREIPIDSEGLPGLFLAVSTLKDPSHLHKGHHTLEIFTLAPHAPFAKWSGTPLGDRGAEYDAFKKRLGALVLDAAEKIIPGVKQHLVFSNVGTPLTNEFYCEAPFGGGYGTAKTPWQLGPFSFAIKSSVEGLYNCGASTISHGVAGAAMSGIFAAQAVVGAKSYDDVLGPADGSMRVYPSEHPELWVPETIEEAPPSIPLPLASLPPDSRSAA